MRRSLIEPDYESISVRRQCVLHGLPRSKAYYAPVPENAESLGLMKAIDAIYSDEPSFGSRSSAAVAVVSLRRHPLQLRPSN